MQMLLMTSPPSIKSTTDKAVTIPAADKISLLLNVLLPLGQTIHWMNS